jgi:uncharacterized protein (DUF4415 family)
MARYEKVPGNQKSGSRRRKRPATARRTRRQGISLQASGEEAKGGVDRILQYYRPLKKPITVRIDADVLAWFKKDGKRYQTRINQALRKAMEREMKGSHSR